MVLNAAKTKVLLITTQQKGSQWVNKDLSLHYKDFNLELTTGDKLIGVHINENLQWENRVTFVRKKDIHNFMAFIKNKIFSAFTL